MTPVITASMRNGTWVYQRVAPTSRMIPTSVRRVNAETWMVLEISSRAASAWIEREPEGGVAHAREEREEVLHEGALVDDVAHAGPPGVLGDDARRRGSGPAGYPQRRGQALRADQLQDRLAGVDAQEPLVRRVAALVGDRRRRAGRPAARRAGAVQVGLEQSRSPALVGSSRATWTASWE